MFYALAWSVLALALLIFVLLRSTTSANKHRRRVDSSLGHLLDLIALPASVRFSGDQMLVNRSRFFGCWAFVNWLLVLSAVSQAMITDGYFDKLSACLCISLAATLACYRWERIGISNAAMITFTISLLVGMLGVATSFPPPYFNSMVLYTPVTTLPYMVLICTASHMRAFVMTIGVCMSAFIGESELHYFVRRNPSKIATLVEKMGPMPLIFWVCGTILHFYTDYQRVISSLVAKQAERERFIGSLSHDLRTPLQGITGILETETPSASDLKLLKSCADSLELMLDNVLIRSEGRSARSFQKSWVNVREFVGGISNVCRSLLTTKSDSVRFSSLVDEEVPRSLFIEKRALQHIILNFLSNAVKYTDEGTIFLHAFMNESGYLELRVEDSGKSLSFESYKKLWEPYFRDDGSAIQKQGVGLGLWIAKDLTERVTGGYVKAGPSPETGGSFFAACFKSDAPSPKSVLTFKDSITSPKSAGSVDPKKIVVLVEDNMLNRTVLSRQLSVLSDTRYETVVCESGLDAIAWFTREYLGKERLEPVLMLLDLGLPVISGWETIDTICTLPCPPLFALISAQERTAEMERAIAQRNISFVLTKPIRKGRLISAIKETFKAK